MKCDCYATMFRREYAYSPTTGQPVAAYDHEIGICNGTRERDECDCGGDRAKCTFYPKYRAQEGSAQFSCRRNRYGKYVVCENCTTPCFVNRLIRERKGDSKIEDSAT